MLLQRGAARVIALDVGHGQLHSKIRDDPRVVVLERTNARLLEELPFAPQLVVCDVSFISVRLALPPALAPRRARAGRRSCSSSRSSRPAAADVPKGVVRDPEVQRRVAARGRRGGARSGVARVAGVVDSGLPGPKGNREFVLHLVQSDPGPSSLPSSTAGSPMPSVERAAVVTHGRTKNVGDAVARLRAVADDGGSRAALRRRGGRQARRRRCRRRRRGHRDRARRRRDDAARRSRGFSARGVPVLGVNFGRVGFLTAIPGDELEAGMARVFAGDYPRDRAADARGRARRRSGTSRSTTPWSRAARTGG